MLALAATLLSAPAPAAEITACFTPGEDCASKIVTEIAVAKTTILLQAPAITLPVFSIALAAAHARGVAVKVMLDRSSESLASHSGATFLAAHGVLPLIDDKVESARNTVIIIDGKTVVTGSFALSAPPPKGASESLVIIKDDETLAQSYSDNFGKRAATARPYGGRFRGL